MSQVTFKAIYQDNPVGIMAGWDRPSSEFFLTIFDDREEAPEETIWSSVESPLPESNSTGPFRHKLEEMGITAPVEFWSRVELCEGNAMHSFREGVWARSSF